ncbi:MAG: ArnT family glycosyltransferase [Chthoniobacterales bacterium]
MQRAIRNFAFLFGACLLFHVAGTWTLPLIDRDEPRFAEASREMLERGDYVIPYFNNRYRFDKPPLTYWCQTVSYRLFGENDFAARFPSTIAASLTALLLLAWGRRLGSERLGWWAAIIFTLCAQTFVHGKAAVADMWLVLFMTAAHWAGYELLRDRLRTGEHRTSNAQAARPKVCWWWIFYIALALAFLAKGPIGWMPLLTVAATRLFLADAQLNRRFLFFTGGLCTLSIVALWGIPALARTNGEFFDIGIGRHVLERSVVAMEGHGANSVWSYLSTLPFYFALVFLSFFPWSFKLPWLTRTLWRRRDPLDNYLVVGIAIFFVMFTLIKTKLPHYTLPAFPLLALLFAKAMEGLPNTERFLRRAALVGGSAALLAVLATPVARRFSPAIQLVEKARGDLRREMEFGAIDYKEPSLIWYFRKHVDGWLTDLDDDLLVPFMEKPGARFVVLPTAMVTAMYPQLPEGWKSYTAQGINTTTGRWVDLTLLLKPK